MSDDRPTRMRGYAVRFRKLTMLPGMDQFLLRVAKQMDLAADDIERLRAELHEAGDGDTWREACGRCEAEIKRLQAENKQLDKLIMDHVCEGRTR